VNISAEHVLKVKGSKGDVDVKFKLAGYNEEVLAKAGITNPVSSYICQLLVNFQNLVYQSKSCCLKFLSN
jgi:hypothetical protein